MPDVKVSDGDPGYVVSVVAVYRRIRKAYEEERGVRLSAEEVAEVWELDDAVRTAVSSADLLDSGVDPANL